MAREYELFVDYFMFDIETIEKMYNLRINGMPSSFWLLDYRKTDTYCHYSSKLFNLVIPGSVRKKGKKVVLNGNEHSWIEVGNLVYDTSMMAVWNKESYYERDMPYDVCVVPTDKSRVDLQRELESEGSNELYVAWIRDIKDDIDNNPYGKYLIEHIARFTEEKGLDKVDVNEEEVAEFRQMLNEHYEEISKFKSENSVSSK